MHQPVTSHDSARARKCRFDEFKLSISRRCVIRFFRVFLKIHLFPGRESGKIDFRMTFWRLFCRTQVRKSLSRQEFILQMTVASRFSINAVLCGQCGSETIFFHLIFSRKSKGSFFGKITILSLVCRAFSIKRSRRLTRIFRVRSWATCVPGNALNVFEFLPVKSLFGKIIFRALLDIVRRRDRHCCLGRKIFY